MMRSFKGTVVVAITALMVLSLLGVSASGRDLFKEMGVILPKKRVGAPAFTLKSTRDGQRSLDEFKNKVILLNFWATWCAPCREEMPGLERLWNEFKDRGLVIIAIAANRGSMHLVDRFCNMHKITFPVLLDPTGTVRKTYEVTALPTSYIIGRDGKIIGKIIGARNWNSDASKRLFDYLLGK